MTTTSEFSVRKVARCAESLSFYYTAGPDWFLRVQQDCEDSLQSSEPEIRFALDYGEQLVDDDLTDSDEKQKIQEDVIDMERTLKGLKEEAAKEKIRYGAYLRCIYNFQSQYVVVKNSVIIARSLWTFFVGYFLHNFREVKKINRV